MFFRLDTLPKWQNFSQARPRNPPKMNENFETRYTFSTKIPGPLEGEGIWGEPPRQLVIKYPPGFEDENGDPVKAVAIIQICKQCARPVFECSSLLTIATSDTTISIFQRFHNKSIWLPFL